MHTTFKSPFVANVLDWCARYRVDVYLLTYALVFAYATRGSHENSAGHIYALIFTSLMVFIYFLNKTTDTAEDSINIKAGPLKHKEIRLARVVAYTALVIPLPFFFLVTFNVYIFLTYLLVALLGYWYSAKIFFKKGVGIRLKDLFGVKTLTSSCIWTLPPLGVWASLQMGVVFYPEFWYWAIIVFSNAAAMEMVWDIRDIAGDRASGVRTIAAVSGVKTVKLVASSLLVVAIVLGLLLEAQYPLFVGLVASLWFVITASPERGRVFFHAIPVVWAIIITYTIF